MTVLDYKDDSIVWWIVTVLDCEDDSIFIVSTVWSGESSAELEKLGERLAENLDYQVGRETC